MGKKTSTGSVVIVLTAIIFVGAIIQFDPSIGEALGSVLLTVLVATKLHFAHEWTHIIGYKIVNPGCKVSIHKGIGVWFVKERSSAWFTWKEMLIVLMGPLSLTLLSCAMGIAWGGTIMVIPCLVMGLANTVGMLLDFKGTAVLMKRKPSFCRYLDNGELEIA